MTRKPSTDLVTAVPDDDDHDADQIANNLRVYQEEAQGAAARARVAAQMLGYLLPADSADPDLIQRDIAANMRRSVESVLEVGRGLYVLKAACPHGQFGARLEVLGLDIHVAARFMQAATKFSKLPSTATLKAIGNQTKLFEMLVLDDEQIEELELTGSTGELDLDDVATMSVKELRAAVRKERTDRQRLKEVGEELNAELMELKAAGKKSKIIRIDPEEERAQILKEAAERLNEVLGHVRGNFRAALIAVSNVGENAILMAGMVGQIQAELYELRDEFNLRDVVGDGKPEWEQWADRNQGSGVRDQ
jgi:hypothetical protein